MSQSWDLFLDDGDNEGNETNSHSLTENVYMGKTDDNSNFSNPNPDINNQDPHFINQPSFVQHDTFNSNINDINYEENSNISSTMKSNEIPTNFDQNSFTPPSSRSFLNQQYFGNRPNSPFYSSSLSSSNFSSFQPPASHLAQRAGTIPRYQTPPPPSIHQIQAPPFVQQPPILSAATTNSDSAGKAGNGANIFDYYFVQFHPNRTLLVKNSQKIPLDIDDYVITEADRGYDIGRIVKNEPHPLEKDVVAARNILRKATNYEISTIPSKEEKEKNARNVCQEKADELGLPMKITATELQFDGKKLTVYFTANQYIDFRNLVHTLFREFGTRIWMVWFDGTSPVRDVFTHSTRERRFTME